MRKHSACRFQLLIAGFTIPSYGAANDLGRFTLGEWATLLTDANTNRIQANTITLNGAVGINCSGVLELAAQGVTFNGTMYVGLGLEDFTSGTLSVILGNLTFGQNAKLDLYWGDSLSLLYDGWSQEYNMSDLFDVKNGGTISDWEKLSFDDSNFTDSIFNVSLSGSILTLSYASGNGGGDGGDPNAVPEPATLLMLGLGAIGAGLAARRKMRNEK